MDINEDNVAPWNVDGKGLDLDSDGCLEPEEGKESAECGRGGAMLGMNDVTTATGCAVSCY